MTKTTAKAPDLLAASLRMATSFVVLCGLPAAPAWGGEAAAQAEAQGRPQSAGEVMRLPEKDRMIEPTAEPVFTVGVLEGEEWETFGAIAALAFDASGNLYVLDAQAARVVVFGPDGGFVRTFGRKGSGPGEMSFPSDLAVLGDGSAAVVDRSGERMTLFSPEGKYERSASLAARSGADPPKMLARPGARPLKILAQPGRDGFVSLARLGGFSIVFSDEGPVVAGPPTDQGVPVVYYSARRGGAPEIVHRAWRAPRKTPRIKRSEDAFSLTGLDVLFDVERFLAVLPDGRMVLSDSTAYDLKFLSPAGRLERRLHRPLDPAPVTGDIEKRVEDRRRRARERIAGNRRGEVAREGAASFAGALDPGSARHDGLMLHAAEVDFAPVIPVVTGLAADWEGRIWVRRGRKDGSHAWGEPGPVDLVTADGRYLGTIPPKGIRIPQAFGPGGLMAYYEEDDDGVPRVAVRRLAGVGR